MGLPSDNTTFQTEAQRRERKKDNIPQTVKNVEQVKSLHGKLKTANKSIKVEGPRQKDEMVKYQPRR